MLGMTLLWSGYAVGLYGYCLLTGKAVTLPQLVNPVARWTGPNGLTQANTGNLIWPPGPAGMDEVIPSRSGSVAGPIKVNPDGSVG